MELGNAAAAAPREIDVETLARALVEENLRLEAQPILDLQGGSVRQHEVLVRLLADDGTLLPPACFLELAEAHGLIATIDLWVAQQAIALIAEHASLGLDLRLEVNISGRSLGDGRLLDAIERDLVDADIPPGNLIFEVTETAAVENVGEARAFAHRLRELGCHFALDDFGSGFASFYYLKHLPFDYVKIDGEFVAGCVTDRTDQLLIQAVVDIAKGLRKRTVAEYVQDAKTAALLMRLGVDYVQGSYVGLARPVETLVLDARRRDRGLPVAASARI